MDLLGHLVSDICNVMEGILNTSSEIDLSIWQTATSSIENNHANKGQVSKNKHKAGLCISEDVRRSLC